MPQQSDPPACARGGPAPAIVEHVPLCDRRLQPRSQRRVSRAKKRLQRRDRVEPQQAFVRVMQQFPPRGGIGQAGEAAGAAQGQYQQAVLGHRQRQRPGGVPAPTIGARQPQGEVLVRPVKRGRVQQIKPPARGQPHPGTRAWSKRSRMSLSACRTHRSRQGALTRSGRTIQAALAGWGGIIGESVVRIRA